MLRLTLVFTFAVSTNVSMHCALFYLLFPLLDVFPEDQLYILYSAENSGVQLGSYVVSWTSSDKLIFQ